MKIRKCGFSIFRVLKDKSFVFEQVSVKLSRNSLRKNESLKQNLSMWFLAGYKYGNSKYDYMYFKYCALS